MGQGEMNRSKFLGWLNLKVFCSLVTLGIIFYLPLRITLTRLQVPDPQGILILGGDPQRAEFGAKLAAQQPNLPIWLTGYSQDRLGVEGYFDRRNISPDRLHYDTCATDTVTDFTCTVNQLNQAQIRHVYLITSDYHLPRATAIAWWVLGSRGIIFTPYSVPCLRGMWGFIRIPLADFTGSNKGDRLGADGQKWGQFKSPLTQPSKSPAMTVAIAVLALS